MAVAGFICWPSAPDAGAMTEPTAATFPAGFRWVPPPLPHQVEGNNVDSDYWEWEHAPHTPFVEPSGDAVDHYHRWREDLDLLAGARPEQLPVQP